MIEKLLEIIDETVEELGLLEHTTPRPTCLRK
ncbi:MAG: hypothetical protein ACJA01_003735 [Saprospiraceae bacterium]|jgi:hypothetical protein